MEDILVVMVVVGVVWGCSWVDSDGVLKTSGCQCLRIEEILEHISCDEKM